MLKVQGNNQEQDHLTDSLHSENQQLHADQSDIPLSNSSIDWMKDKFEKQNDITDKFAALTYPDFNSWIQSKTHQATPEAQPQEQSINNDLSKSIVTPEIAQVLKDMGFHIPIDCASGRMSVDELNGYCNLYSSSFDNECITEILGALIG